MTASGSDGVYEREVRIAARPEVVFQFFLDPAKIVRWKGTEAALDPRPGGIYRVNVTGHDIARGEYLEIVPHSRIVFTWGWEEGPIAPGSTTVEVTLTPSGDGTIVRLRQQRSLRRGPVAAQGGLGALSGAPDAGGGGRRPGPRPLGIPTAGARKRAAVG